METNSALRNGGKNQISAETSLPLTKMGRMTLAHNAVPDFNECLCYRPQRTVLCINCGFLSFGRVLYICKKHPEIRFLYDWPLCPNCRGYCLNEF